MGNPASPGGSTVCLITGPASRAFHAAAGPVCGLRLQEREYCRRCYPSIEQLVSRYGIQAIAGTLGAASANPDGFEWDLANRVREPDGEQVFQRWTGQARRDPRANLGDSVGARMGYLGALFGRAYDAPGPTGRPQFASIGGIAAEIAAAERGVKPPTLYWLPDTPIGFPVDPESPPEFSLQGSGGGLGPIDSCDWDCLNFWLCPEEDSYAGES